jgi:uncharacterized protein YydD (DUF2326 family)
VNLEVGMNVIVADRSKDSTRTDSRNGLGKSTLIEIIHFVLGSNLTKEQNIFALRNSSWEFTLRVEIRGIEFSATRAMSKTSEIHITGSVAGLALDVSHQSGGFVKLNAWRSFLGRECYNLTTKELGNEVYKPSFRALFPYAIRSGRGAYLNAFEARAKQLRWQTQVYNAYLLGLNWRLAAQWQHLRDTEKTLKAIGKSSEETLSVIVGQVGELETERIRLEARVDDLTSQAENFRVVKEYREVEDHVNRITFEMQELAAKNTFESRLVQRYEQQIAEESPVAGLGVVDLFDQVGVSLPEIAVRTLDEVADFHAQVTQNRQEYLRNEVLRLRNLVTERNAAIGALEQDRQKSLSLLESGGALEDFTKLQMKLVEARAELLNLEQRIEEVRKLRSGRTRLVSDKQGLLQQAIVDHDERRPRWTEAIANFASNTNYLYGQSSDLIIDTTENGFDFRTRMEASGSHGRDNMAILCYDLVIAQLWANNPQRPGILVHDSEMFDPVDERQYALALNLAAEQSNAHEYQYLALLNSDTLPLDDLDEIKFDIDRYTRLRLTDGDPSGSLLGIRF